MTESQKEANRRSANNRHKEIRDRGKCVYLHRNPKTKEVFYVGIGNEDRAVQFSKRSIFWSNYRRHLLIQQHSFSLLSIKYRRETVLLPLLPSHLKRLLRRLQSLHHLLAASHNLQILRLHPSVK